MTVIQTTKSRTCYHVFDLDTRDDETVKWAKELLHDYCDVVITRGGYHILVPNDIFEKQPDNKNWYVKLKAICDVTGDALIPVIGCYQGGHIPTWKHKKI